MGDVEDRLLDRDLLGQGIARLTCAHRLLGHDRQRLQARGRLEAHCLAVGANDEAAIERRGDVVGVTLDRGGAREQVDVQLEQVVGGEQAGDDRRGARAEAAGERDVRADAESEVVGGVQALEGAHAEVVLVPRDVQVGLDGKAAGLCHLQL